MNFNFSISEDTILEIIKGSFLLASVFIGGKKLKEITNIIYISKNESTLANTNSYNNYVISPKYFKYENDKTVSELVDPVDQNSLKQESQIRRD